VKPGSPPIVGVVLCILSAVIAMGWAAAMMGSMYAFRSPLAEDPPPPAGPIGVPLTRRVVVVLIDALRDDTSRKTDVMPYLNELRLRAASATMHSRAPSFSQTGNTILFTGGWQELSDAPLLNLEGDGRRVWSQDNLFSAAHRAGLKTAAAADLSFRGQIPQDAVNSKFYTVKDGPPGDAEVVPSALQMLQDPTYALVLIHIDQVDYAGHHLGGADSQAWIHAAHQADAYLSQIAGELDFSRDTLLVISDHGQLGQGGHGGPEPIVLLEPFVLAGRGVRAGAYPDVQMVDVAPTLAALLGTNLPASSEGKVLTGMLTLDSARSHAIQGALSAQQGLLAKSYSTAIGQPLPVTSENSVARTQQVIQTAQGRRLSEERLPRLGLAVLIGILPAIFLYRNRTRGLAWLLAGTLIYFIVFNALFLLVFRRTYSLSTVDSAGGLLGIAAVTNFVAFATAWLVVSLAMRAFRHGPFEAARQALGLTLLTLYALALVMLINFVMNGIVITWAVPELHSMFVGFFAMLQSLFVSMIGLALVGIGALVALVRRRVGTTSSEGFLYEDPSPN